MFLASRASQYVCGELLVVDGVRAYLSSSIINDIHFNFHPLRRVGWAGRQQGAAIEEKPRCEKGSRFWRLRKYGTNAPCVDSLVVRITPHLTQALAWSSI